MVKLRFMVYVPLFSVFLAGASPNRYKFKCCGSLVCLCMSQEEDRLQGAHGKEMWGRSWANWSMGLFF